MALLVGVSNYDDAIGLADLEGPPNDVRLLRDALGAHDIRDVTILADKVEGGTRPTREAILGAFADLQSRATSGDLVIIHMSGHGTRQPDQNGDEADGYDELFLPADVKRAEPGSGVIPNALVDDEIGEAVDDIRRKGADVWFVMDSCHSGTGLRAASTATRDRYVDPALLGIEARPARPASAEGDLAAEVTGEDEPEGGLVAFYAAQSSEVAREVDFAPEGSSGAPSWFGLFTAKLASRLREAGAISYRQLFQAVMADMNDESVPGAARLQTPFWEGTLIDATVLGGSASVGIRQFEIDRDLLSAGSVHGLSEGTVLELVPDATTVPGEGIGYAQIDGIEPLSSYVRPVAEDCEAEPGSLCPRAGELPSDARYARVVAVPIDSVLRLSPITDLGSAPGAADEKLEAALKDAVERFNARGTGRIEIGSADYDVAVGRDTGQLWFGRAISVGEEPIGLAWKPEDGDLLPILTRIALAERLAATMAAIAETGSPLNQNPVEISVNVEESDRDALSPEGPPRNLASECRNYAEPRPLAGGAPLKQCDRLDIAVKGAVSGSRDVNRIYIDSHFCVWAHHERVEGTARPTRLGEPLTLCSDCPDYSAGDERLFVLVSEAKQNADQINLEGLVETCTRGATRSAGNRAFSDLIESVSKAGRTRGAFGGLTPESVWVEEMSWKVLPRRVALGQDAPAPNVGSARP
ncbi:caspase family protein [Afifella sp. IM 167]|uniref:caspase family protein n=1 Tax=Afifella sp. IM 167 TaxID=2033586 RepID=UPI001CCE45F0|nr:caspase family protein [Afifella sp. IM 167]